MIVFDAKPLTASLYNLSRYSNSTTGQEKLRVSRNVAISSVLQHSEFNCEIQGYSSKNVYLHITGKISKYIHHHEEYAQPRLFI